MQKGRHTVRGHTNGKTNKYLKSKTLYLHKQGNWKLSKIASSTAVKMMMKNDKWGVATHTHTHIEQSLRDIKQLSFSLVRCSHGDWRITRNWRLETGTRRGSRI